MVMNEIQRRLAKVAYCASVAQLAIDELDNARAMVKAGMLGNAGNQRDQLAIYIKSIKDLAASLPDSGEMDT